ncbi:hypothetical protein RFI_19492, partial [Reticulomyxa filosa]
AFPLESQLMPLLTCVDRLHDIFNKSVKPYLLSVKEISHKKDVYEQIKLRQLETQALKDMDTLQKRYLEQYCFCLSIVNKIAHRTMNQCSEDIQTHLDFNQYFQTLFLRH